jgi:hypothetical protein
MSFKQSFGGKRKEVDSLREISELILRRTVKIRLGWTDKEGLGSQNQRTYDEQ